MHELYKASLENGWPVRPSVVVKSLVYVNLLNEHCVMCRVCLKFAVCNVQCGVYNILCSDCSVHCVVCSVNCALFSVQFAVCSV